MNFLRPLPLRQAIQVSFQPQKDATSLEQGVLQRLLRSSKAVLLRKLSLMFEDDHELKTASRSRPTDRLHLPAICRP